MEVHEPTVPSAVSVRRLREELTERISALHGDMEADLGDVAQAVADDQREVALQLLCGHIDRLDVFAADLRQVLAGAVVEREAESVLSDSSRTDPTRAR